MDPDLIIIHGPYILGGEYLINRLKDLLKNNYLPNTKKEINLEFSKLGEKAGLYGAVGMVMDNSL